MNLTGPQIGRAQAAILSAFEESPLRRCLQFQLDKNLDHITKPAKLPDRVFELLNTANNEGWMVGLLRALKSCNPHPDLHKALDAILDDLLKPTFISATGDPHDAILLGPRAFIGRKNLRSEIRHFTAASSYTSRVLVVSGEKTSGKSHTWLFLLHLAREYNVQPILLELRESPSITPRELFGRVGTVLGLGTSDLPAMPDDPQESRTLYPLLDWFQEKVNYLRKPCWLVIDDLNESTTTPSMQDAAYAIARFVEKKKPEYLWVALLGYDKLVKDRESTSFRLDEARYPDADEVSIDLGCITSIAKDRLKMTQDEARRLANLLFFLESNSLDKEAKLRLASAIETMGGILLLGPTDPDVQFVACYFEDAVRNTANRLSHDEAVQYATLIFEKSRNENAQDLPRLAVWIKEMRDKLKAGQRL